MIFDVKEIWKSLKLKENVSQSPFSYKQFAKVSSELVFTQQKSFCNLFLQYLLCFRSTVRWKSLQWKQTWNEIKTEFYLYLTPHNLSKSYSQFTCSSISGNSYNFGLFMCSKSVFVSGQVYTVEILCAVVYNNSYSQQLQSWISSYNRRINRRRWKNSVRARISYYPIQLIIHKLQCIRQKSQIRVVNKNATR